MLLLCVNAIAQFENVCVFEDSTDPDLPNIFSYKTDKATIDSFDNIVFNVHTWVLLEDNDESNLNSPNYNGTTVNDALEAVAVLNRAYNRFKIFFKYNGIAVVNDSDLALQINTGNPHPTCTSANYPNHTYFGNANSIISNNSNLVDPNSFNVYVIKDPKCFGGSSFGPNKLSTSRPGFTGATLVHEFGHSMGLRHTRGAEGNPQNTCEHVTRDPNDTNFNAHVAGDYVVDTAASPDMSPNETPYYYNPTTCNYIGPAGDCQGTPYELTDADMKNTMSNAYSCLEILLTDGQGIRIREQIPNKPILPNILSTNLESLYEPYQGQYYDGSSEQSEALLFQPGFDYRFVRCKGDYPQPADYNESFTYYGNDVVLSIDKDETDFSIITHPNHTAIKILQIFDIEYNTNNEENIVFSSPKDVIITMNLQLAAL